MSLNKMVEKLLHLSEPKQMKAEISLMGHYDHVISADRKTGVLRMAVDIDDPHQFIITDVSESIEDIIRAEESDFEKKEFRIAEFRIDSMILQQINELKISLSNKEIRAEIEKGGTPIENIQNLLERLDFAKEIAKDRYFDNMPDFRKAIVEMTQKVELLYKGEKAAKKSKKERNQKPNKLTNDNREYVKKLVKLIVSAENHEEAIRQLKNEERKFTGIGDKTLFTKSTKRLNASQMARVISDIGRFKYGEKFPDYETVRKELRYHL